MFQFYFIIIEYIMGNIISQSNNIKDLNFIVSYYLYSLCKNNLEKLMNKKYCEKLITLINKLIIKQYQINPNISFNLAVMIVKLGHIYSTIMLNINPLGYSSNGNKVRNYLFTNKKLNKKSSLELFPICKAKNNVIMKTLFEQMEDIDYIYQTEKDDIPLKKQIIETYHNDLNEFKNGLGVQKNNLYSFISVFEHYFSNNSKQILLESSQNNLFYTYGNLIALFIQKNTNSQNELLGFLDKILVLDEDSNHEKLISINDKLTSSDINDINNQIRTIVLKMNIDCEEFVDIINQIYEAIIEYKIFQISKIQINYYMDQLDNVHFTN